MKLSHFFIERPVFASVLAILITLLGAIAFPSLPIAQYPEIVPPTVNVSANYPGASAEVLADSVAAPIEQQINGVENMLYMSSNSTGDGHVTITVTFKLGTDPNQAQVLVQNRVASATPQLPSEVVQSGVTVRKSSSDFLMAVHMYSPDGSLDQQYIANYVGLHVHDALLRVPGVGDIGSRAARDYAMRIWIDPDRAAARNLTSADIVSALQSHNIQVAAGAIGQPPQSSGGSAYQLNIQALGRLSTQTSSPISSSSATPPAGSPASATSAALNWAPPTIRPTPTWPRPASRCTTPWPRASCSSPAPTPSPPPRR